MAFKGNPDRQLSKILSPATRCGYIAARPEWIAFARNAEAQLEMTRGLSTDDEPDIWQKSLSGDLELWVTLGLPSEKVIRQSCSKSAKVTVYAYGGRQAEIWWDKIKGRSARFDNLQVVNLSQKDTGAMARQANRSMKVQVNVQDGDVMVSVEGNNVYVSPDKWKAAG